MVPSGATTFMPYSLAGAARSTSASTSRSSRPRIRVVSGLRYSEQGLSRGNLARSSSSTSAPARASSRAVAEPAGPAPTTMASNRLTRGSAKQHPAEHDRSAGQSRRQIHTVVVQPSPTFDEHDRFVAHGAAALGPRGAGRTLKQPLDGGAKQRIDDHAGRPRDYHESG